MTIMKHQLKPCPFCGQKVEVNECLDAIQCHECGLTFGAVGRLGEQCDWHECYESEDELIRAWNRRES